MEQQGQSQPLAPPGSQDAQRIHPTLRAIGAERATRDLLAVVRDKPERWIEALYLDLPIPPRVKIARYMAPVIVESRIDHLDNSAIIAFRHKGTQCNALRPDRRCGLLVHLDLHVPVASNLCQSHACV